MLDPLNTSTGALALLAIQSERQKTSASDTAVNGLIVPLAQRLGSMAKPYTDVDALFGRAAADGSQVVVPASEQSFVKYQEEHPDAQLKAVVPATGTLYLDYPIAVTAKSTPTRPPRPPTRWPARCSPTPTGRPATTPASGTGR